MTLTIDKGVALPPARAGRKYPFRLMKVGESFFAPGITQDTMCSMVPRKYGKWATRVWREGNIGGVRVWRIA